MMFCDARASGARACRELKESIRILQDEIQAMPDPRPSIKALNQMCRIAGVSEAYDTPDDEREP